MRRQAVRRPEREDVVRVLPLGLSVTVLWRKHDDGRLYDRDWHIFRPIRFEAFSTGISLRSRQSWTRISNTAASPFR